MEIGSQKVTRLISQACAQYPGGLRAVFRQIQMIEGKKKSETSFYADFNANETSNGNLKVRDFLNAMQVTGDYEALRYIAAMFGFSLTPISSIEPDAPTVEAEMLQDYPAVVAFHDAVKSFRSGSLEYETVLARLEGALLDLRQTAAMARQEKS